MNADVAEDAKGTQVPLRLGDQLVVVRIANVDQQLPSNDVFARFDV
jgi:hypothetical protein